MVNNLGWILADEASGSAFGKRLIFDYLREKMPSEMRVAFASLCPLSRDEILNRIYQAEKPSTFLASLVQFLATHRESRYCQRVLRDGFKSFFSEVVSGYQMAKAVGLSFCGSVAQHFAKELTIEAEEHGYTVQRIVAKPLDGLVAYHQAHG